MKYNIKYIDKCYICLDEINYYYKLNCNCHQLIHDECLYNLDKCTICKQDFNFDLHYDIQMITFYINMQKIFNSKITILIIYLFNFINYIQNFFGY